MVEILLGSITLILNTFFGLFVFDRNVKSWTNRLFFLLAGLINIYLIVNYLSLHPPVHTPENQLFWIRVVMFVTSFIGPTLLFLVHTFPHNKFKMSRNKVIFILLLCGSSATLSLLPFVFKSIEYPGGQPVPVPGYGIPIFFIDFVGLFIVSFILLIIKYKKATGIEKIQHLYFLLGILSTFSVMAVTTVVFVVILKFSGLVFIGPNATLFLILFLAYAIIRHRFLDIHLIVARSVAYALLLLLLAMAYVSGLVILAVFVTQQAIHIPNLIASAVFTLILIFSFQPLRKFLEKVTAQTFYKQMYSTQTLLWNMSRIMASTLVISDLTERMLKELIFQMSVRSASIILTRESSIIWTKHVGDKNFSEFDEKGICKVLDVIVKTSTEHILIFDEMYESPEKKVMRDHNIAALLALIVQEELIGAIILSEKASGDIYSLEDINVLKILAPEISVAVKNALSYDEIKQFNSTLQKEVSKATDEVKNANETMYKRNLELTERNKTLALLRKIDDAILTTVTDTTQIAQRVSDMIIFESRIKSILIVLVDEQKKEIGELATAPASIMHQIDEYFKRDFRGVTISLAEKENILIASITNKTMQITADIYDVVRPLFTKQQSAKLQDVIGAKSYIVYPMIVHGIVIGAMAMGLEEEYENISEYQRDLISRLVSVMGIAIDNALLYKKIAEANERLKQLDLLKDEFVSVASHELRTPMTAIKSYLWLALADKAGPLNEKLRFYIDRSYISTNRLIKLVNDMLNVSRIESGRMSFDVKKTDMVKLVEDTIAEVKSRVDELGITIVNKFDKTATIPATLADEDKIKEVLINLIGNSLKFTPRNGSITVWFEKKDNMVITNVTDTGEGINEEDIPKLFQKFGLVKGSYQTNKQSSQGTGLGLYICNAIMKEHGGDVWAHSPGHGKGATFSYSLKIFNEKDFNAFKERSIKDGLGIIHSEV